MTAPIHLHPTAPLAERVLLPGDPGRALLLAQTLLTEPKMFNHNRGLWGYTGTAPDGQMLTVQSTGMGGPSAAIVISELIGLGGTRMLRVGSCGALSRPHRLGELLIVAGVIACDGTSRALGAGDRVQPDPQLTDALQATGAGKRAIVASTDLFYDAREGLARTWLAAGAEAVEMETATLFALAARHGIQAAAVLVVTDLLDPRRVRIGPEALREAEQRMGEVAALALATRSAPAELARSRSVPAVPR